jgi:hypothetical protein
LGGTRAETAFEYEKGVNCEILIEISINFTIMKSEAMKNGLNLMRRRSW